MKRMLLVTGDWWIVKKLRVLLTLRLVPQLRDAFVRDMVLIVLHRTVQTVQIVQNGDGQLKMESWKWKMKNTKRYVQRVSKVYEWLSKTKKIISLCLCAFVRKMVLRFCTGLSRLSKMWLVTGDWWIVRQGKMVLHKAVQNVQNGFVAAPSVPDGLGLMSRMLFENLIKFETRCVQLISKSSEWKGKF